MLLAVLPYTALLLTTTIYAGVLAHYQERIFPRFTWLTVVIGFVLCWAGAWVHLSLVWPQADWQRGLIEVFRAFVIGGLPIVIWKVGEDLQRPQRRAAFWKQVAYERSAQAVAEKRTGSPALCPDADADDHDSPERSASSGI